MIELDITQGHSRKQRIVEDRPSISIGRSVEKTIFIADPYVSRHHGEIFFLDQKYQYRDLNSTHGTVLRRDSEEYQIKQVVLREQDDLFLGSPHIRLTVQKLSSEAPFSDSRALTIAHVPKDVYGEPEEIFADDAKALASIIQFDKKILDSRLTSEHELLTILLEHVWAFFPDLDYAAILDLNESTVNTYDFKTREATGRVRQSSHIIEKVRSIAKAALFEVQDPGTMRIAGDEVELSQDSVYADPKELKAAVRIGICAPILPQHGPPKFFQMERAKSRGKLGSRDASLIHALALRIQERIDNMQLIRQNLRLHQSASLGVFAGMIGHDIKNYLFYSKKFSDIAEDPVGNHPGLIKGIERARKLAQGMKDLASPGRLVLQDFDVKELLDAVAEEFRTLFGKQCAFEVVTESTVGTVSTSEDLLSRIVWNLVMNAYHTAESRGKAIQGEPWVRLRLSDASSEDAFLIRVEDNAGGIRPQTLDYLQRSFDMVGRVYNERANLINVVNQISNMRGFTNSVGMFFTAVAVQDMGGTIQVETVEGEGSAFVICLPRAVESLRNLLIY